MFVKSKSFKNKIAISAAILSLHASNVFSQHSNSLQVLAKGPLANCQSEQELADQVFASLGQYFVHNEVTGETKSIPTENFLFCKDGKEREFCQAISKIVKGRSPQLQERINHLLTEKLRKYGMSFAEKKGSKTTFFDVPVNGIPMVLSRDMYNTLVQSTAPVLRANRVLDQLFYSSANKEDVTPAAIREAVQSSTDGGQISCSDEDLQSMLLSMKDSIYDLKELHDPSMKHYPFMSIAGVDAMIDQPEPGKIRPIFAEFNLGTPSGISNIRYALSAWIEKDPMMAAAVLPKMAKDNTYSNLRATIEKNAAAWTGIPDGVSVMVGAGVENGAHPDISSISYFSGMPLVKKKDLYIDQNGLVHLNTGAGKSHPIVTGIYSRSEESYLLNDNEGKIPFIHPAYSKIEEIFAKIAEKNPEQYSCLNNEKVKATFIKGAAYKFIYGKDKNGKVNLDDIIGVQLDKNCHPVMDVYADELGVDPKNPQKTNLADAVKNHKLYTNVVGGRLLDDKKVFEIVSKCIAPLYLKGEQYIAVPPKSYTPEEFVPLLTNATNEELAEFVLKKPDGSSGEGVYILMNHTPEERRQIVDEHLNDPDMVNRMVVQEFVHSAAMTMPMSRKGVARYYQGEVLKKVDGKKLKDYKTKYLTQANDLRIFVMMDDAGNVVADPHSVLVRTAKPTIADLGINGESRSNTGKGGGYGVLMVLEDSKKPFDKLDAKDLLAHPEKLLNAEKAQAFISASKQVETNAYLTQLHNSIKWIESFNNGQGDLWMAPLENIRIYHRKIMEILGPQYAPMMDKAFNIHNSLETQVLSYVANGQTIAGEVAAKTNANKSALNEFRNEVIAFAKELCTNPPAHIADLPELLKNHPLCNDIVLKKRKR